MNELLSLFIRTNDSPLDSSAVWDYLTLKDLYQLRSVCKHTYDELKLIEYNHCRDGNDYLVPFPGYPGVLCTNSDVQEGSGLFTHQLSSLRAMHRAENKSTTFGSLRGGILGDAPGLGKTITMLSLITSTAGLRPIEPKEFYDNESVNQHWQLMRTNPVFREEILRALRPFRACGLYEQLANYVSPPYNGDKFQTLNEFEHYVNKTMRPVANQAELDLFRRSVIAFKAGLDKRNRRFFANEKGKRMIFERNLIPCSTTLVIVPDALLEHWAEQIRRHVNLNMFVDQNVGGQGSEGVVYIDGVGDLATARFPLNHQQTPLPSAFDLMSYMIVVVPFARIKQQYNNARKRQREDDFMDKTGAKSNSLSSSSLLQLRWFRIIVDEGHELGENDAGTNVTKYINEMGSERRWVLSGTPTTGDEDSPDFTAKGLDQLQRLLLFLRHERYGAVPQSMEDDNSRGRVKSKKEQAKGAWEMQVKKPFLRKEQAGREELYKVMDEIMVMHKKEDLSLPKPIFKQSQVSVSIPSTIHSGIIDIVHTPAAEMSHQLLDKVGLAWNPKLQSALYHGKSALYDTLVSEYLGTDKFQMLVDQAQATFVIDSVTMERRELEARGGASQVITAPITAATMLSDSWIDRRPVKAVVYSSSHNNLLSVAEYLYESFGNEHIAEMLEGKISNMSYELGRFRRNYKEGKECPICGGWNEFVGKKLRSCSNRLLEVTDGVNKFLIEPERIIRGVGPMEFNSELNNADLLQRGQPVEMTRLQGAPLSKYNVSHKHWRVGDVLCIDARNPHPLLRKRWDEEKWKEYGSERCIELAESDGYEGRDNYLGSLPNDIDNDDGTGQIMIRLLKWQPCGRFHSRPRYDQRRRKNVGWYKGPDLSHVEMRTQKEDTFLLLLDASLSHGLDLSFVTHMFLLEPIDDAALLEQVTSRAHRLGCTGPCTIDTVNVWQKTDSAMKEVAKQLSSTVENDNDAKTKSSRAVCEHCYRSFETLAKAEEHELTCDRNPDSTAIVDPFHLSSVYRDIKPPLPMQVGTENGVNSV